jgi:hypothetical protein
LNDFLRSVTTQRDTKNWIPFGEIAHKSRAATIGQIVRRDNLCAGRISQKLFARSILEKQVAAAKNLRPAIFERGS